MQATLRGRLNTLRSVANSLKASVQLTESAALVPGRSFWSGRLCLKRRVPVDRDIQVMIHRPVFRDEFWRPFSPVARTMLADLQTDMKLLRDQFWTDLNQVHNATGPKGVYYGLDASVSETKSQYKVVTDVPGVEKENVKITVSNDGTLDITATRVEDSGAVEGQEQDAERRETKFRRVFRLPEEVDRDGIQANLKNGRLEVVLPKVPAPEPMEKEIKVNVA